MQHKAEFKTSFVALMDAQQATSTSHPTDGELIAYHEGELPTEERERLQNHLVECRECFGLLRGLESFSAAALQEPEAPASFEEAAFWRVLKPQLATLEPTSAPPAERTWWHLPAAIAATFVLTVLGFSAWTASQQLSPPHRPQPNVVLYDLAENASARTGQVNRPLEIAADGDAVLILTPDAGLRHGAYQIWILDTTGKLVSKVDGLEKHPRDESFTLSLPAHSLPPGAYRMELYGLPKEEKEAQELIADYRIQMVTGEPR